MLQRLSVAVFSFFLVASALKAIPLFDSFPIDLTLLGAAGTSLLILCRLSVHPRAPKNLLWPLGLFTLFLIGGLLMGPSDYVTQKILRLFTLTFLATVAPHFLLQAIDDVRSVITILFVVAFGLALYAFSRLFLDPAAIVRLSQGDSPIIFSRLMGLGCVVALTLWLVNRALRYLLIVPFFFVALVGSASRGALLATFVAVSATYVLFHLRRKRIRSAVLPLLCVMGGMIVANHLLPEAAIERAQSFTSDVSEGRSIETRLYAYEESIQHIAHNPQGIGWGSFGPSVTPEREDLIYPHNLLLEIALEGGWIAFIGFMFFVGLSLHRAYHLGRQFPRSQPLFALLVFFLVTAMFSSDINGNRFLFAMTGLAFSVRSIPNLMTHSIDASGSGQIPAGVARLKSQ